MRATLTIGATTRPLAEVTLRAQRLASALRKAGVAEGDAIALLARNGFPFIEVSLAARRLDAYVVPLNWHWHPVEIGQVLEDCAPRLLIADADLALALGGALPIDLQLVVIGDDGDYDRWVDAHPPEPLAGSGLGSSMIYTSGTTGRPKAVRRLPASPEEAAHRQRYLAAVYDVRPDNVALVTGPLYHLFPQAVALSHIAAGASVVVVERFDAEQTLALIERHRVTHAAFVPTLFTRLLRLPDAVRARYDLSSLRFVIHSGAPCPLEVKRAMIDWLGPIVHESYGSTETGVVTRIDAADWLQRPGSVGRPLPTGEVRIYDEAGRRASPCEVGDVFLRIQGAPDFTFHNDPAKRAAVERDGFITCGDMGWLDEEGYLFLCDRRVDMIISGGVNIYPAEIEGALLAHPAIRDAAVFGVPDAEYGEAVAAHVETELDAPPLTEADVRAWVRGKVAGYKVPRLIVFEPLRRQENGKLAKRALRGRYSRRVAETVNG